MITTDTKTHLTTSETARHLGANDWQVRRAVDSLEQPMPRAGRYRLIPVNLLEQVRERMVELGYLPAAEGATAG